MMNPYVLLAIVLAWGASVTGSFFFGRDTGMDSMIAEQEKTRQLIEDVEDRAQRAAAEAIAGIKVVNQVNRQVLEREIVEKPVYRECRHTDDGLRAVNSALENRPVAPGDRKLPEADPAH
jgi:hypothetical protein